MKEPPLALGTLLSHRQVVATEDHVLTGHRQRAPVGRAQDVVGRQHQHITLDLRLGRQRHMDRHLVTVEVGVEGCADQRMDLDGLALDEHRLESLDAEAVQASARGSEAPGGPG